MPQKLRTTSRWKNKRKGYICLPFPTPMKKYVYILSNSAHDGLLKIGKTDGSPHNRADQLSRQTGAIGHFVVEWSMEVPDNDVAEKILHYIFRDFHHSKEFFKVPLEQAIIDSTFELILFFNLYILKIFEEKIIYIKNKNIIKETVSKNTEAFMAGLDLAQMLEEDFIDNINNLNVKKYYIDLYKKEFKNNINNYLLEYMNNQ